MVVVLTGCPTGAEELPSAGNDYIAEAVLLNEREKYQTAVVLSFEAGDAGTDVTARFMQLSPGKTADSGVSVSILGTSGNGFFALQDERLTFTGNMPPEEPYGEKTVEPVSEPQARGGSETPSEEPETVGYSVIPNGEVVTLLFQKDGASELLEVLGIIEKKGTEKDDARSAITAENQLLLYGVDVLNSAYINRNAVKSRPILDAAKVAASIIIQESQPNSLLLETAAAESISGVFESINTSAGNKILNYKATLFAGNATREFATGTAAVPTRYFAKIRQVIANRKTSLPSYSSRTFRPLLSQDFIADVNAMSASGSGKITPKYIIDTYGTHLIAGYYSGGTAELNYSYTGTSLTTEADIKGALNAAVTAAAGTTLSAAEAAAVEELNKNSSFTSSTRGGNSTSWTTAAKFSEGYSGWRNSIAASPDICAIPNLDNDLIPIWDIVSLVDDNTQASLVKAYFNTLIAARKQVIQSYKATDVPFVTDISALTGIFDNMSGYPYWVKADMYSDKGDVLNANAGIWGLAIAGSVYIAYQMDNKALNHSAVAEIEIATGTSSTPPKRDGWTIVPIDLNHAVSGPYLWLQYRKVNENDTQAVDFIGSYCAATAGDGQIMNGYSWVSWQGSPGARADLNQGAAGKRIYLTVHKVPFKW